MRKIFIDANQLQRDSFALAKMIIESDYRPTFLIGLWRGGCPIAITVHETLEYCDIQTKHTSVRVSSYKGIDQRTPKITVHDLSYVTNHLSPEDRILIVDDVHDTGLSMAKLIEQLRNETPATDIKIAVAYFKPDKSQVNFEPDFYLKKTNDWLVFPHEICGLNNDEIENDKQGIESIKSLLLKQN